jgi:hypothetical protein
MLLADLADLGAEVIRVDRPGGNSPRCRRRAPASPAAASAASSTDRPTDRGEPKALRENPVDFEQREGAGPQRLFGPVRAA